MSRPRPSPAPSPYGLGPLTTVAASQHTSRQATSTNTPTPTRGGATPSVHGGATANVHDEIPARTTTLVRRKIALTPSHTTTVAFTLPRSLVVLLSRGARINGYATLELAGATTIKVLRIPTIAVRG
jgi:hypothetical protein